MTDLRVDQASGRFDGDATAVEALICDSMLHSDIILTTESRRRVDLFARISRQGRWSVHHRGRGPLGECAVLADRNVWTVRKFHAYEIGPDLGPGDVEVAALALLEHVDTHVTVLVSVAHLPAGVEGIWSKRPARVIAYLRCVRRWKRLLRQWSHEHRPDAVLVTQDSNLNVFRLWVQKWIKVTWIGYTLPENLGSKGSLGRRFIDWPLARRVRNFTCQVLADAGKLAAASDHQRVRIRGTIRPRRKHLNWKATK